ncbi:MAG: D-galactonate dehydratase family protein [Bacteroidales bacterium]|nr:D-galactonate dehydratase family protein [Bacteroidales bacterium]
MKIKDAEVVVCSPTRNFVTLIIHTDEGIYGLGDATLNGRELAVAEYLKEHCIPALIGRNPFDTEDIWQYFYKGAYWKRGPVTMTAIAAIDVALWDIKAKALSVPLYQLLGGKSRDGVLVYCHANGTGLSHSIEEVHRHIELGYKAIRVQSGIPGIEKTYGVASKGKKYEPATRGLPQESVWSTSKYLNFIPKLFEAVRNKFGFDIHLLHDCHHRLTPVEAARFGKDAEPYRLFWMEDPGSEELQESFRLIRNHTTTPIAVGEIFNSVFDCNKLITEQLIDYLRMTIVHGGGITHLLKTAHLAEIYNVRTGFHGATDLSPVTMAAALHFDMAIHNFGIQEHMPHEPLVDEIFPHAYTYKDGFMYPGEAAGLGVGLNRQLAAKYPYQRAYLPVNRLEDGTVWNW